jgi:hypothetical protein
VWLQINADTQRLIKAILIGIKAYIEAQTALLFVLPFELSVDC